MFVNLLFCTIFGSFLFVILAQNNKISCREIVEWGPISGNIKIDDRLIRRLRNGVINIKPNMNHETINLQIKLNRKIREILGNSLGEVSTDDNQIFNIMIPNYNKYIQEYIFKENVVSAFNFYVAIGFLSAPNITRVLLNSVIICDDSDEFPIKRSNITTPVVSKNEFLLPSNTLRKPTDAIQWATRNTLTKPTNTIQIARRNAFTKPTDAIQWATRNTLTKPDINQIGSHENLYEDCGFERITLENKILNGETATVGEFPWHAAIFKSMDIISSVYICGGSLVSKQFVITVAHCVTIEHTIQPINNEHVQVHLGKHLLRNWADEHLQSRSVDKIIIHKDFNFTNYLNNLALLKLKRPVIITNYVRPVCLWRGSAKLDKVIGKSGVIAGWGRDKTNEISNKLNKMSLSIIRYHDCHWSDRDFLPHHIHPNLTFCAGDNETYSLKYKERRSVCLGDAGGGMVFPEDLTGKWQLIGLVSLGKNSSLNNFCTSDSYLVLTNMLYFTKWVQDTMKYN